MLDRERVLAADHEARLHADADARRVSVAARSARSSAYMGIVAGVRATVGRWLVAAGSRLTPEPDPCGPTEPRAA